MNTRQQNTWTAQQFIDLSRALAVSYGTAVEREAVQRQDAWTSETLLNMSNSFGEF